MAGLSREALADLGAQGRAHGDVLEVRVARGEAAGGGHRLVERGMEPTGPRVDGLGQGQQVGGQEFRELAVIKDVFDDRMAVAQGLERLGVGGVAGLGLALAGESQALEEDVPSCWGEPRLNGAPANS
jgi:hypothetical protein